MGSNAGASPPHVRWQPQIGVLLAATASIVGIIDGARAAWPLILVAAVVFFVIGVVAFARPADVKARGACVGLSLLLFVVSAVGLHSAYGSGSQPPKIVEQHTSRAPSQTPLDAMSEHASEMSGLASQPQLRQRVAGPAGGPSLPLNRDALPAALEAPEPHVERMFSGSDHAKSKNGQPVRPSGPATNDPSLNAANQEDR